jgi:hypothetical protein
MLGLMDELSSNNDVIESNCSKAMGLMDDNGKTIR